MPTYAAADGVTLHYDLRPAAEASEHRARYEGGAERVGGFASEPQPPVIVLAGGAARHPDYLGDLAGLNRTLVLPHLRGIGDSPAPADVEAGSFWQQADDVEALRVHLGLSEAIVIGHSAGTRLATAYAVQFPSSVQGLVLITPPAGDLVDVPSDAGALVLARSGDPAFDRALQAWTDGPDTEDDDDIFNTWQRNVAPMSYAAWGPVEQAHTLIGRWNLAAVRSYFSVEPPADLAARLATVTAPVLVIAGAQDCLTGLAPVLALAELFPAGSSVVIADCGHYPWVEQPATFRQAVTGFLTSVA